MAPIVVIGDALDDLGVKRFDVKAFLLGFVVGRAPSLQDDAALRRIVEQLYPRRGRS